MARDYCTACGKLKAENANFMENGVTTSICNSLKNDTGLTPALGHDNCEDLADINDCLLATLRSELLKWDGCDWKGFVDKLIKNILTTNDAFICSECGQWSSIHDLEEQIALIWKEIQKIWNEINNIKDQIQAMASQNYIVQARYNVSQATPGFSVNIDRDGTFTFAWADWNDAGATQLVGRGVISGKVNYCMDPQSNQSALWRITSFTINSVSYTSTGNYTQPFTITLRVPSSTGTVIYNRSHNGSTSFTDAVGSTTAVNKSATIGPGSNSGWQTFLHFYNDGPVADDEGDVQLLFTNNNLRPVPRCS